MVRLRERRVNPAVVAYLAILAVVALAAAATLVTPTEDANIGGGFMFLVLAALGLPWSVTWVVGGFSVSWSGLAVAVTTALVNLVLLVRTTNGRSDHHGSP